MIARLLLALTGALLLAGCGAPADAPDAPAPSPALWEVTSPDGKAGWLFGTVHALPRGMVWQTPALDHALDNAGLLVVEIANLGDPEGQEVFSRLAQSPGLPPLSARVPAADRPAIEQLLEQGDRNERDFATIETWAAAILLSGSSRVGDPELGADRVLLERGLPVVGLETHEVQFTLFDRLPQAEQADLLVGVAREEQDDDGEQQSLDAWLRGDLAALESEGSDGILADPELREALLDARNRAWVPSIADMIAHGRRPFVAVGAAHMLGEHGLPALLAAQGYAVRRIQ